MKDADSTLGSQETTKIDHQQENQTCHWPGSWWFRIEMIEWEETSEVLASQMTALQFHMSHEEYVF